MNKNMKYLSYGNTFKKWHMQNGGHFVQMWMGYWDNKRELPQGLLILQN